MNKVTWKGLSAVFGVEEIIDAFFAALFYATLLMFPVFIILIQVITVYMFLLTWMVILMIMALILYAWVVYCFWQRSLTLKKPDATFDIKTLFRRNFFIVSGIISILGLIFLFVLIPLLWV